MHHWMGYRESESSSKGISHLSVSEGYEITARQSVPDKVKLGSLLLVPANQKDILHEPQSKKGIPWLRLPRDFS